MNDAKYPELPHTDYVLGCEGDGYSADRLLTDAAYDEYQMRSYADATCALRGAQKESGWRPISEAPQDGTPILAWNAEYGARETRSVTYTPGSPGFAEGLTDRWWQWEEPKNNWSLKWQPTHWMPLPSAPTPEGEAK